jgi:hypothetical protein
MSLDINNLQVIRICICISLFMSFGREWDFILDLGKDSPQNHPIPAVAENVLHIRLRRGIMSEDLIRARKVPLFNSTALTELLYAPRSRKFINKLISILQEEPLFNKTDKDHPLQSG